MNITLSAGGRAFLTDGLILLLKQTKSAQAAEKKAYLSTSKSDKQIELIEEASHTIPAYSDLDDVDGEVKTWDIPSELHVVYRDALLAHGTAVARMRYDSEKYFHLELPPAKKRVVDVQATLKLLGDMRDILVETEERERKKEKEVKLRPDRAQGTLEGMDGNGGLPPRAADVSPIRSPAPARKAASKSPRPPGNPRGRRFQ